MNEVTPCPPPSDRQCDFCAIARGRDRSVEVICEAESWIAFFPLDPATPGHTLVIPLNARARPVELGGVASLTVDERRHQGWARNRRITATRRNESHYFSRGGGRADRLPCPPSRCAAVEARRLRSHLACRGKVRERRVTQRSRPDPRRLYVSLAVHLARRRTFVART